MPENPEDLKNLVEKAKDGDKEAFSSLYRLFFTPIYRYIYFRTGSKAEAEDLTQDVFLKAYASLRRYSYSGTSPLAYFYTIARNSVIDYRRKKKMVVADDEELSSIADDRDNPQEQAIKSEDAEIVKKKIVLLPEEQQDVIVLRFIDGLSTKEIATMLAKSEEAVRQLQSRGLKFLRKHFLYE